MSVRSAGRPDYVLNAKVLTSSVVLRYRLHGYSKCEHILIVPDQPPQLGHPWTMAVYRRAVESSSTSPPFSNLAGSFSFDDVSVAMIATLQGMTSSEGEGC